MKKLKVGINGFGRIGRAIFRSNYQSKAFDVVAINEVSSDNHNIAYLLQYDSTYGRFPSKVLASNNSLKIERKNIAVYHQPLIWEVPWEDHGVDIIIESSGEKNNLLHIDKYRSQVKNVVVTCDIGNKGQTIIFGCNEKRLNPKKNFLISASICDAVALAPIIKLIEKTHPITSGYVTTFHSWLSYQNLLDGPAPTSGLDKTFSQYGLGRASSMNLIPKSTSAIAAVEKVIPNISKRIMPFSFRVPTNIVSGGVLTAFLKKDITKQALLNKFKRFEKKQSHKIFKNTLEPLTSIDYIGEEYSAIIDHRWTEVHNKRHIRLQYWHDNEWGYSSRVNDLVGAIGRLYQQG